MACNFLGIYPDNIERGADTFAAVCEAYGLDEDALWDDVRETFETLYGANFGNTVNALMFDVLANALERKGIEGEIDYEVNGFCVGFYVNGESY